MIDAYILEVYFDGPVYLSANGTITPFTLFNFTFDTISNVTLERNFICMGASQKRCLNYPPALQNLIGIFSLECSANGTEGPYNITSERKNFISFSYFTKTKIQKKVPLTSPRIGFIAQMTQ